MNKKIFNAIWIVAIVVFLSSLIFILGVSYDYFSKLQMRQLKVETELAVQGVNMSGQKYLDTLETKEYRVTWVDANGKVLYDTKADKAKMENHFEREEIKEALDKGYGESVRYSSTLAEKQLYSAMKLDNGSVLRLSIVQMAIWTLFVDFAQPICIVMLIALILSIVLASRISKMIIEPINNINLDNPMEHVNEEKYEEVAPLLKRIHYQQEQLKKDKEEIHKASLIRQEFSANVSHELKSPLHAISGYAELLENGMVKAKDIKPFATKIRIEASRMTTLVEDIIHLTKLDEGGAEQVWEECDIYKIAENALDSLISFADEKHVNMELKGESTTMYGVSKLLYSVIYNLCDNAIKYNVENGRVTVFVESLEDAIILRFKDTGVGIPDDAKGRIFERFYRVDKSRSKEVGGTGLGLSIVKHAVLLHKGDIKVTGKYGEGTEFEVRFPK
ncbi:MAG: PAS domain-containing sensor histidine kinase [Lachnospiraceae bacterium]|nr:PAS domain-containing sensor histidine kinase [Lachnospiraceae bacterium]